MHRTTALLEYESERTAALIASAVQPEAGEIAGDRTSVAVDRDGPAIEVTVDATDPVALRAGQNTWLGFFEVAEDVIEVADGFTERSGH